MSEEDDSISDIQEEEELMAGARFRVPWLDTWFNSALEDETLAEVFRCVSEELGRLVLGQYKCGPEYAALLQLLGPIFVGRYFEHQVSRKEQTVR